MENILERLSALEKNFTNVQFLTNRCLSNEVGIYIFAYDPKDERAVQEFVRMQKNRNSAYNIIEFDLYKTFISIWEERKIIKSIPSMQERKGSEYLKEQLKKVANPIPDLLAKMRTDYVHEQQERYITQIENLESEVLHLSDSEKIKAEKALAKYKDQLVETSKFEEKLHHLADKMISIDLDDGFKQNYPKFECVVAKVK